MIDEKLQEKLLSVFDKRFQDYNTKVLEELGNVIKQFKDLTPSQAYKLGQQLKYNTTIKELLDELSKISGLSVKDLKAILEKVAKENIGFADVYYKSRGLETPIYSENKALQRLVSSVYSISGAEFKNIAKSTGFRLLDNNGKPLLLDIDKAYKEVIDRCVVAISQGKETYQQSMRSTLKQLSSSGVRKIEYESGYSRRLDTSIRQNILDSIRQVSNESQQLFGKEFDSDGVEVSVHEMPAPDHELVQGRQFSNKEFDNFQNDRKAVDYTGMVFEPEFEGHDRRSISEYNCYHYIFSIVLGVSKPQYSDKQLQEIIDNKNKTFEFDGKIYNMYEGTQLQRRIESAIREAKDTQILARASEDNELVLQSQTRITQLTTKYKQLCNISGLPNKLSTRASVSGYKRASVKKIETKNNIVFSDSLNKINDEKLLNRNKQQIIDLTNKYPKMQSYLKENKLYIGSAELTEVANTSSFDKYSSNYITLNYKKYNDKDFAKNEWLNEGLYNARFLKENADIYTTTHEYGHVVLNKLYKDELKNKEMLDFYNKNSKFNFENTVTKKYNLEIQKIARELENDPRLQIRDYASGYGRTNELEMFAEMFAESQLGKDTIISRAMQEFLKKYLY